ncbi:sensor histidine kinase [Enhygromyxa salina]|uniref:histidine kinase n=1 Tax=Enhygromyxa salina TaxID=215803 RepID=A0A2S9YSL1_9BACT|nr:histidine kinase [Enhygromyxa salina]PRQ08076.1 Sensor histidine kinase ComP [Enhygromyxa salina]
MAKMSPTRDAAPPDASEPLRDGLVGFERRARELSATNVATIAGCSALALLLFWPTDLLVVGADRQGLIRFACYRLLAVGCCVLLAWLVARVPVVRRSPAAALSVGAFAATALTLISLGPYAALDRGWMDLGYLLPLATCALLVPLGRRVMITAGLSAGGIGLYVALNPEVIGREFAWVNLLVAGLAVGLSVYLGHTLTRLLERTHASAQALEATNRGLEARITRRQAELRAGYYDIVGTREDERLRLARELHDATGQVLTGLRLGIGLLRREVDTGPSAARLARLDAMLDELFTAIHEIVRDLRPSGLDDLGLLPALAGLAASTPASVRLTIDGERWDPSLASLERAGPCAGLSSAARIGLYRIAQASLGLFVRFESTAGLAIELDTMGAGLAVRVTAEGVLPDPQSESRDGILVSDELAEIIERARMLGARVELRREAPAAIAVEAPLPPREPSA